MLRNGVALDRGLASARLQYGASFQPAESLRALSYFRDGNLPDLSRGVRKTLADAVKSVRELPDVEIVSQSLCGTSGAES